MGVYRRLSKISNFNPKVVNDNNALAGLGKKPFKFIKKLIYASKPKQLLRKSMQIPSYLE